MLPSQRDVLMVDNLLPPQRSLRVAMVTETYPPEVNGVAATVSRVVEGLLQRGHELQLVRPRQDSADNSSDNSGEGGRFAEVLMRGLPIPRYPQLKMGLPSRRALVRLWTARRPDLVHLVTEGPLGWSALQAAAQLKLPVVSDFRTNFHAYSQHYGVAWMRTPIMAYLRKFHNRCASTMVPTEALRQELQASGFQRVRVVARGVDTQRFDPARRSQDLRSSWGAGPDTLVAMCVGRIAPEKNLQAVLAAAAAMRATDPGMRLVLVGDGPEKARLEQAHPEVLFAGLRRGEDLAAHYASADVFLFPSLTETFGNVVMEAMASGLAVVAYDQAAAGQLIRQGDNGLLAPSGDGAGFSRLARQLVGDLPRARAMGQRARETARRMDWGRIVEAVEAAYAQAIEQPFAQPRVAWAGAMPAA